MNQPPPDGWNNGGWTPPQQPGQWTPPQQPGQWTPPQQPGQWTPPQQPGQWTPPQQPGQWTPPQQPGQWGPPQQPGQWGPPQQPDQWGPPQQPDQWGPPQAGPGQPFAPQPAPNSRRRAGLIASVVAFAVLAGGGAATYIALSSSSESGAATPRAAVQKVVGDLQQSDLVGFLDDLAPGERDALSAPLRDDVDKLKQLHVVKSETNLNSVSAAGFTAHNLTYAAKTVTINDHVQIVQLTGGTIDVRGDAAKLFTSRFLDVVDANSAQLSQTSHVDIAAAVRSSGGPIRIATVKVGDRWYPSLFYTMADQASNHATPRASDAIAATGASSGEQAVRQSIQAGLDGDLRGVIALVSPAELGALHDYGGMLLDQAGDSVPSTNVTVQTLDLTSTPISGGAQRISLKHLVLTRAGGEQLSVTVDGNCITATARGKSERICADEIAKFIGIFQSFSCSGGGFATPSGNGGSSDSCDSKPMPEAQKQALGDLFSSFTKLGVVTSQSGGKWYVAPVRTMADLGATMLSGLKGDDIFALLRAGSRSAPGCSAQLSASTGRRGSAGA